MNTVRTRHARPQTQAGAGQRWQYLRLLDAPHRLAFTAATLLLAVSSLWWAAVMVLTGEGVAVRWSLRPSTAHGVLMTFGFMPLFFTGFLFTAGPKWLQQPAVDARTLVEPLLAMLSGWGVFLTSLHGRDAAFGQTLGAIGIAAVATGWLGVVRRFLALLRASTAPDKSHATVVAIGCVYGLAALLAVSAGLALGADAIVRAATVSALWAFVGLVFCAVAHRMVPFFSGTTLPAMDAWRPQWLLVCFSLLCGVEAAAVSHAFTLPVPAPVTAMLATLEIGAGLFLLAMAIHWGRSPATRLRLPAMLHLGFSWLAAAVLLTGLTRALELFAAPLTLGLAPIHAFTMGFLGSMMLAMVTRVTRGLAGHTVVADDLVWRLFWVLQLATAIRLTAAILAQTAPSWTLTLLASAALGWAGVCLSWTVRHVRLFGLAQASPHRREPHRPGHRTNLKGT
jgi:uncharacterized protein involved in response to NO